MITFRAWQRSGLYDNAQRTPGAARLTSTLPVHVTDGAHTQRAELSVVIRSAADVTGLTPSAIRRSCPPPGAVDVTATQLAWVELAEADLPWRYTPELANTDRGLRPWLVLLVGPESDITVRPDGQVDVSAGILAGHDLAQSARWAHLQLGADGAPGVCRLLSPACPRPDTDCVAVVVPAFTEDGRDRWPADGGTKVTLPAYHLWRFRTGPGGTFESVAARLHPPDLSATGPAFGSADLTYSDRRTPPSWPTWWVPMGGALGTPTGGDHGRVAAMLAQLADASQGLVGPPDYAADWPGTDAVWREQLRLSDEADVAARVAASLGVWCAIELQDRLASAAADAFGAATSAAQRVRHLAAGEVVAERLWSRLDGLDEGRRLQLYGPGLRRVWLTDDDQQAAAALCGGDSPFPAALLGTAGRRTLRRGTARTPAGPPPPEDLLDAVAARNPAARDAVGPAGLPVLPDEAVDDTLRGHAAPDTERDEGWAKRWGQLWRRIGGEVHRSSRPVGEGRVGPARRRVLATINPPPAGGEGPLPPLEAEPALDVRPWRFLRDRAPEWLLPGVGTMSDDTVAVVPGNAAFVDAFLAGLNGRLLGEMRWRNLPVTPGCTPVRDFWEPRTQAGDPVRDIPPYRDSTGPLGDRTLASPTQGEQIAGGGPLVLVFRSELFRRWPTTTVYLAPNNGGAPDLTQALPAGFTGAIGADVVFFAFPTPPGAAETWWHDYWGVLEEPPPGFGFGPVQQTNPREDPAKNHGAWYAAAHLDRPARVQFTLEDLA